MVWLEEQYSGWASSLSSVTLFGPLTSLGIWEWWWLRRSSSQSHTSFTLGMLACGGFYSHQSSGTGSPRLSARYHQWTSQVVTAPDWFQHPFSVAWDIAELKAKAMNRQKLVITVVIVLSLIVFFSIIDLRERVARLEEDSAITSFGPLSTLEKIVIEQVLERMRESR